MFEDSHSTDRRDETGAVDRSPVGSGGLDQLEDHRQSGGAGAGTPGDLREQADGGESGLDGLCGWSEGVRQSGKGSSSEDPQDFRLGCYEC